MRSFQLSLLATNHFFSINPVTFLGHIQFIIRRKQNSIQCYLAHFHLMSLPSMTSHLQFAEVDYTKTLLLSVSRHVVSYMDCN